MKKKFKIIACVVVALVVGAVGIFSPYMLSFVFTDEEFYISKEAMKPLFVTTAFTENFFTEDEFDVDWFNYYGVRYTSNAYLKGTLTYKVGFEEVTEEFFLEPSEEETKFYSFIDNCLDGKRSNKLVSLVFQTINRETAYVELAFEVFNRDIPKQDIYIEADNLKLGVDLLWGGALCYLEDTDSNVQAVEVDGQIKVDSNAADRYNAKSVNNKVNLINCHDTGRLVQQSYYGTLEYDKGVFMDNEWRYNPVQGGNQFNDVSKIVDLKVTDNSIYIKCRPLDWAKEKEDITPSYMEARYTIEDGVVHTKCRFVDFSGYPEAECSQEIPAFYCIEPLNNFVYYAGDKPWTNDALTNEPELIFWPDAGYPKFYNKENWAAFTGEFEDSFGIGVYVKGEEEFLAGVYNREQTTNKEPAIDDPTSYIAITKTRTFKSFEPYEYEYYLATGNANEIRETFKNID